MTLFTPKHVRIVQAGYETYSGPLGPYEFVNGVSVEAIPLVARDRLSVAFQMVEIEDDGSETPAGPAHRLLQNASTVIEPHVPARRQSEDEKCDENVRAMIGGENVSSLRSRANLEAVADKMGIAGIRLIAEPWGVRSKSIPALIDLILGAQQQYIDKRVAALVEKGATEADARALFVLENDAAMPETEQEVAARALKEAAALSAPLAEKQPIEPVIDERVDANAVVDAANSGDLAKALNQE